MAPLERQVFYPSGKPQSRIEPVGGDHSLVQTWSEDGTLIFEYTIDGNREYDGHYRSWWDNGVLKEEGDFRAGKRVGTYRWFFDSGQLWKQHSYD